MRRNKTMKNNQQAEADNVTVPLLSKLNVGQNAQRFFYNSFSTDLAGRLVFNYDLFGSEIVGFNSHKLCISTDFWSWGNDSFPTDIFLFFSAMEAIAFTNYFELNYDFDRCLFVSLGVKPSKSQVLKLKGLFHSANYHTVFGNDLLGHIYDCKISVWLNNKDCHFSLKNDIIHIASSNFNSSYKTAEIHQKKFKFSSFCRVFGKRVNLKIHKPKNGQHIYFFDLLKSKD
ncbi:hypothetical protein AAKU52_002378 [Pedobacter sp. CG_S7]